MDSHGSKCKTPAVLISTLLSVRPAQWSGFLGRPDTSEHWYPTWLFRPSSWPGCLNAGWTPLSSDEVRGIQWHSWRFKASACLRQSASVSSSLFFHSSHNYFCGFSCVRSSATPRMPLRKGRARHYPYFLIHGHFLWRTTKCQFIWSILKPLLVTRRSVKKRH